MHQTLDPWEILPTVTPRINHSSRWRRSVLYPERSVQQTSCSDLVRVNSPYFCPMQCGSRFTSCWPAIQFHRLVLSPYLDAMHTRIDPDPGKSSRTAKSNGKQDQQPGIPNIPAYAALLFPERCLLIYLCLHLCSTSATLLPSRLPPSKARIT
jgi:hypothetical protein